MTDSVCVVPTGGDGLLSTGDAARAVGVTANGIYRASVAGLLPVAAIAARGKRLFRPEDVEAYRQARLARLVRALAATSAGGKSNG